MRSVYSVCLSVCLCVLSLRFHDKFQIFILEIDTAAILTMLNPYRCIIIRCGFKAIEISRFFQEVLIIKTVKYVFFVQEYISALNGGVQRVSGPGCLTVREQPSLGKKLEAEWSSEPVRTLWKSERFLTPDSLVLRTSEYSVYEAPYADSFFAWTL